ncbi:MAG: amidophosphoribosyltransferase [Gemmatimonadetes bacterium]|nr:amidophosphoribosyltransferase [Gemmatimonadota bacterium]
MNLPVIQRSSDDDKPREECGIFAVTGLEGAAELTYLGLYALQHRGQESAGICVVDGDGIRLHKDLGLVAEVFSEDRLRSLGGHTAIGHVRYSTAGNSDLTDAQPILVRYAHGQLAVAHNGNITNAYELRARLVDEGAIFQTTSDTEVVVHLIARSRHESIEAQLDDALTHLEGAFSLILLINDTVFAVRDSWGFRPLVLGRKDGGLVVASETCALDIIGAEYLRAVAPGEVLMLKGGTMTPLRRLPPAARPAPCIFELVYFARPDSHVWDCSVDRARRAFGRRLAQEHPVEADAVLSVPDSSNSAALGYSEQSGIPYELGLIRNHYVGRTFIQPVQTDRDFRTRIKYNAVREAIEGRRIVVVDDSLIRGTTSRSLVRFIRSAGAREVHFRVGSPPVRYPCFYGIDMPTREELVGARLSVDQIREHLGVDSLGYLSLEGMKGAVAEYGPFCDACFSGDYTAPLTDLEHGYPMTKLVKVAKGPAGEHGSHARPVSLTPDPRR